MEKKNSLVLKELSDEIDVEFAAIQNQIVRFTNIAEENLPGLSLAGKLNKLNPKLKEMKSIVDDSMSSKISDDAGLNKLLRIKERYFNSEQIQERNSHFIAHVDQVSSLIASSDSQFGVKKVPKNRCNYYINLWVLYILTYFCSLLIQEI